MPRAPPPNQDRLIIPLLSRGVSNITLSLAFDIEGQGGVKYRNETVWGIYFLSLTPNMSKSHKKKSKTYKLLHCESLDIYKEINHQHVFRHSPNQSRWQRLGDPPARADLSRVLYPLHAVFRTRCMPQQSPQAPSVAARAPTQPLETPSYEIQC